MGEIADMMLDGTLCEQCGEYIDEGDGFPRLCAACKADNPVKKKETPSGGKSKKKKKGG
jgi:hypothetical protein